MIRPIDRELEQEFWVMAEQINQRLQRRKRKGARIPCWCVEVKVKMNTFKELSDSVLSRVGEDTANPDTEILPVIKDAINQAYLILRSTVAAQTNTLTKDYADQKLH